MSMENTNLSPDGDESGTLTLDQAAEDLSVQSSENDQATDQVEPEEETEGEVEASEESQDEEADEADDSDADDEPESDAEEIDLDTVFEIDGEEITLKELQNGNMRNADYTRGKQRLQAEIKEVEANKAAIEAERAKYAQALEQMAQMQPQEQEPDWDQLYQDDPLAYVKAKEDWRDRKEAQARLNHERQQVAQQQQYEDQQRLNHYRQSEQAKLLEAIPEWSDRAVAAKEQKSVAEEFQKYGFKPDELDNLWDSRAVRMARRLAHLEAEIGNKAQVIKAKTEGKRRVLKASTMKTKGQKSKSRKSAQMAKLDRSGSIEDALAVMVGN